MYHRIPTGQSTLWAAASYVWAASIVVWLLKTDDGFVQFHAKQGVILFAMTLLWWIPVVGWILNVTAIIAMVIGFVKAYQGELYAFPVVSQLARKIRTPK